MNTFRNITSNFLLAILSALFAFFLGELMLRIGYSYEEKRQIYMRTRNVFQYDTSRITYDPITGYRLRPELNTMFTNKEFGVRVQTDHHGYRNDGAILEGAEILLTGDSFGFGWGVGSDSLVSSHLSRIKGKGIYNLSTPGHGTLQQFLALRQLNDQYHFKGKEIVFLFFGENDIWDNLGYGLGLYPMYGAQNDSFRLHLPLHNHFEYWCQQVSLGKSQQANGRLFVLELIDRWLKKHKRNTPKTLAKPPDYQTLYGVGFQQTDWQTSFNHIATQIRDWADSNEHEVKFVFVPSVRDFEQKKSNGGTREIYEASDSILARLGLPMLDLTPYLDRGSYFKWDDHWNEKGHRLAAQAISEFK